MSIHNIEKQWKSFITEAGLEGASCISISQFDEGRRVYLFENQIFKIRIFCFDKTNATRANDLLGEYKILKKLEGVHCIPMPVVYRKLDRGELLGIELITGSDWESTRYGVGQNVIIAIKVYVALLNCSWQKVAHNDVNPRNVMIDQTRRVYLIDFDQARETSLVTAAFSNLLGMSINNNMVMVNTMKSLIIKILPGNFYHFLQRNFGRSSKELQQMRKLPTLPENASESLHLFLQAWNLAKKSDANAPGGGVAYYSLDIDGVYFPGERPWKERWDVLKKAGDYNGKKILELGCNMGILSCFLIKEAGAAESIGIDYDKKILKSAELVAKSFGVDMHFKQLNFDSGTNWEAELIKYAPDVVFALNVINWIDDKERFCKFLSNFSILIIEGHDVMDVEIKRLKKHGFLNFQLLSMSERNRPVVKCTK